MSKMHPGLLDADSRDQSVAADVVLRQEPDEEEDGGEGGEDDDDDDDNDDTDDGYSE